MTFEPQTRFGSNFPLVLLFIFMENVRSMVCFTWNTSLVLGIFFLSGAIFSCKYRPANHKYENNPTKCVEVFCLSVVFCLAHFFIFSLFRLNKLDNPVVWRDARFGRRAPHTWSRRNGLEKKSNSRVRLSVVAIGCILFSLIFRHHFTFIRLGVVFIVSLFWTSSTAEIFKSLCDVKNNCRSLRWNSSFFSSSSLFLEIVFNSVRKRNEIDESKQFERNFGQCFGLNVNSYLSLTRTNFPHRRCQQLKSSLVCCEIVFFFSSLFCFVCVCVRHLCLSPVFGWFVCEEFKFDVFSCRRRYFLSAVVYFACQCRWRQRR